MTSCSVRPVKSLTGSYSVPSGTTRLSPSVGTVSPTQLAASDHRAVVPPLSHVRVSEVAGVKTTSITLLPFALCSNVKVPPPTAF